MGPATIVATAFAAVENQDLTYQAELQRLA